MRSDIPAFQGNLPILFYHWVPSQDLISWTHALIVDFCFQAELLSKSIVCHRGLELGIDSLPEEQLFGCSV